MAKRKRYFFEKQEALKRSPNLSISKTRVMIRNIPAFGIDKDDLAKIFEESAKQWKEENKAN